MRIRVKVMMADGTVQYVTAVVGSDGTVDLNAVLAKIAEVEASIPTKTSELTNDSGYITGYTESDPTVPAWAKAAEKPSYTKSEVGLGNVDNVQQYSASNPPPYPVTSVNGKTGAVTIDASAVGALPASTSIPSKVSELTNDAGYAKESNAETWTFTLADGSEVTKKVVLAP